MKKIALGLIFSIIFSAVAIGFAAADNDMNTGGDASNSAGTMSENWNLATLITAGSGTGYLDRVTANDFADYYKIYVEAGQILSATLYQPSSATDFSVWILTPDGQENYFLGSDYRQTRTIDWPATVSGYYIVEVYVRSYDPESTGVSNYGAGQYTLTVSLVGETTTPTTTPTTRPTATTADISTATSTISVNVSNNVGSGNLLSATENGVTSILVTSENDVVVDFAKNQLIKSLVISTDTAMQAVSIEVEQTTEKPSGVSEPSSAVSGAVLSHYLEITVTPTSASSVQVDSAIIDFKVLKSWVTANSIDHATVVLLRYGGDQWAELTTTATGSEDTDYVYYRATTSGFSTFAVIGKSSASELPFGLNIVTLLVIILVIVAVVAITAVKLRR